MKGGPRGGPNPEAATGQMVTEFSRHWAPEAGQGLLEKS